MRWMLAGALLVSAAATAEDPKEIVQGDIGEKLDAYFTALTDYGFSGAILVAKDGEVQIAKGYGPIERGKDIPVTSDSVFSIGSITKQFTAAAIMKLVEMGKVNLDDPVAKYFPHLPEERSDITLHHLLTHSAANYESRKGDFDPVTREEIVDAALNRKLRVEPGRRYRYSNAGYSVLGAIVEKVSGQGYEEFLNEHLFKPAGMKDTGYLLPQWDEDRIAQGYHWDNHWGTVLEKPWLDDGPGWVLRANGGIHSTVWDMYAWHKALLNDSVLSDESRELMFTPHQKEGTDSDSHYGYGWVISTTERGTKLITHNGGNGVMFADVRRYLGDDIVIIYMTSTAPLITGQHERDVRRIVFGFPVEMPPPDARKDRAREE